MRDSFLNLLKPHFAILSTYALSATLQLVIDTSAPDSSPTFSVSTYAFQSDFESAFLLNEPLSWAVQCTFEGYIADTLPEMSETR